MNVIELAVKISVLMAGAAVATGFMRRRSSAASRHLVWTLAVIGVLALPIASLMLPSWPIPLTRAAGGPTTELAPAAEAALSEISTSSSSLADPASSANISSRLNRWSLWSPSNLIFLYAAGVVLLLARLGLEQWKIRRLLSRTTVVIDPQWTDLLHDCTARLGMASHVRLLRSREQAMPTVCGTRRPIVIVPSIADMWDEDRRRAVLLHELAHVARFDCLTQTLAEAAVALYWLHPGAWWMAHRLRVERELACDDCVLTSGTEPHEYAGHLLEIAHALGGHQAPALAVSMARPGQLEGRMLAMLDATRSRATPAAGRRVLALAVAAVVVAPLAAATTVAVPATGRSAAAQPAATSARAEDGVASSTAPGTWQIRISATRQSAQLTVSTSEHSSHSMTIPLDRIDGLAAMLTGPGGPAHYSLKRDAGTFDFEGTIRSGAGGGTFTFSPSATFSTELARRGFAAPSVAEQQALAGADIGFAFIDELAAQQYARPNLEQLVNAARHGVARNYVREMSALGYRLGTVDALIRMRDHGVDPQFIRDLQAEGLTGLGADDFVRARDHGVDPQFARDLAALGYSGLSLENLIAARDHGVSTDYVKELRQLGYQLTLAELTAGRDHGVDANYAKAIVSAGYERPALGELIRLRDHGVTPEYAQRALTRGDRPSIDRLIALHDRSPNAEAEPGGGARLHRSDGFLASLHRVLRDFFFRMFS